MDEMFEMDEMDENRPRYMTQSETVNYIRAILMSHKGIYSLNDFLWDFEKIGGFNFPTFGYGNVLEFLKSIPGTVTVFSVKNTLYVKPVPSPIFDAMMDDRCLINTKGRRRRRRGGGRRRQNARKEKGTNEAESEDHSESPNE